MVPLSGIEQIVEPLKNHASGMPNGMAFVIYNIALNHAAWEPMTVDRKATRRNTH